MNQKQSIAPDLDLVKKIKINLKKQVFDQKKIKNTPKNLFFTFFFLTHNYFIMYDDSSINDLLVNNV